MDCITLLSMVKRTKIVDEIAVATNSNPDESISDWTKHKYIIFYREFAFELIAIEQRWLWCNSTRWTARSQSTRTAPNNQKASLIYGKELHVYGALYQQMRWGPLHSIWLLSIIRMCLDRKQTWLEKEAIVEPQQHTTFTLIEKSYSIHFLRRLLRLRTNKPPQPLIRFGGIQARVSAMRARI